MRGGASPRRQTDRWSEAASKEALKFGGRVWRCLGLVAQFSDEVAHDGGDGPVALKDRGYRWCRAQRLLQLIDPSREIVGEVTAIVELVPLEETALGCGQVETGTERQPEVGDVQLLLSLIHI